MKQNLPLHISASIPSTISYLAETAEEMSITITIAGKQDNVYLRCDRYAIIALYTFIQTNYPHLLKQE